MDTKEALEKEPAGRSPSSAPVTVVNESNTRRLKAILHVLQVPATEPETKIFSRDSVNVPIRAAVVNHYSIKEIADEKTIEKQWLLFSELIRQEVLVNDSVRKVVQGFVAAPVNERLPQNFMAALLQTGNTRVTRLLQRYDAQLGRYCALPSVPDQFIKPDISNADLRRSNIEEGLADDLITQYGDKWHEQGKSFVANGILSTGITAAEKTLIAHRYKMARDVKMLALQSEVMTTLTADSLGKGGTVDLGSGAKVVLDKESTLATIISAENWQRREQIKDRVYKVTVAGRSFILKEQKTARHTDTMKNGHRPTLDAAAEYATAKLFYEQGSVHTDQLDLTWEKPIGFVQFPDGFQFTVFEMVPDLKDESQIKKDLQLAITKNPEQFKEEYAAVCQKIPAIQKSALMERFHIHNKRKSLKLAILQKLQFWKKTEPELSFEAFARVKTTLMIDQAEELQEDTVTTLRRSNTDHYGRGYHVHETPKVSLEIIGFDEEYFNVITDEVARQTQEFRKKSRLEELPHRMSFLTWKNGDDVTNAERAAYYALLQIQQKKGAVTQTPTK